MKPARPSTVSARLLPGEGAAILSRAAYPAVPGAAASNASTQSATASAARKSAPAKSR